jgi:hypothetical protein
LRLPKLESDSDPMPDQIASIGLVSPLRRDRDDVVSLFAPMAAATNVESASHALVKAG